MDSSEQAHPSTASTSLSLLKAADGDCLFLRCIDGDGSFNMLVDAGRTSRVPVLRRFMEELPEKDRKIDLFLVTHIDSDHIEGALQVAKDEQLGAMIAAVMFNGARHAQEATGAIDLSPAQGTAFTDLIAANEWEWNAPTQGKAVHSEIDINPICLSERPRVCAWVLSPSEKGLANLSRSWPDSGEQEAQEDGTAIAMGDEELDIHALASTKYVRDKAVQNGSSIALLIEHAGARILLSSDSHSETLSSTINQLFHGEISVDVATVPHHGSKHNTSPDLAKAVVADKWTISTEQNKHNFPNGESLARILMEGKADAPRTLVFNSSHAEAALWDDERAKEEFNYTTLYPATGKDWVTVTVPRKAAANPCG